MLRLSELQKKIDEATEEMRHITQDNECNALKIKPCL
jgi:hypothetical protein